MSGMFSSRWLDGGYNDRYNDGYDDGYEDDELFMDERMGDRPMHPMEDMFHEPAGHPDNFTDYFDNSYAPQGPRTRPSSSAFDPPVDGGPRTPTLFSDHLIEEMAHERSMTSHAARFGKTKNWANAEASMKVMCDTESGPTITASDRPCSWSRSRAA